MRKVFTTKNISGMAVFSALSFIVYLLEIPIFASTPASFLQLDLSNVFVMLAGFMYGPIPAILITIVKETIHITVGSTGGVGELANTIITTAYVLIPSIVYTKRKGLKTVIFTLVIACIVQVGVSVIVNRYVNFPFFTGSTPFVITQTSETLFSALWVYVLAFNAIKSVVISILTVVLYKKTSYFFKKINLQNSREDDKIEKDTENVKFSNSEAKTIEIAQEYAKSLSDGDVVLLEGDLGAGKTAFVKGVAKYFGLDGVTSPTYAYLNVYGDYVYHYDCYRISSGEDAEFLGLTDYFNGKNICLIEWASNIADVLPKNCKTVKIEKISKQKRKIIL